MIVQVLGKLVIDISDFQIDRRFQIQRHSSKQARNFVMSQVDRTAASNGSSFRSCSFGQGVECVWTRGARTLHEPGNPRNLENLIKQNMKKSPGAKVIYFHLFGMTWMWGGVVG